jgi:putative transposase
VTYAFKSIKQHIIPTPQMNEMMETFRQMVNHCIKVGLEHDASTLKRLTLLSYSQLAGYDIVSYYKVCAISHAAGILANRKKSLNRGLRPRMPYAAKPMLISCYGFKIISGVLKIPIGKSKYLDIPLNNYARKMLSDPSLSVRAFTLTTDSVSICVSKEVAEIECTGMVGVDRNLGNVCIGNGEGTIQYDLSKAVEIAENTRSIIKSFKRNDFRIRRTLYRKYGRRRKRRINQMLHRVTRTIVQHSKQNKTSIAFEDIRYIRRLYQTGNRRGPALRARLNGWSFFEVKRQIEYKAKWEGLPVIQLSVSETRGTSQLCPQCGKKTTQEDRKFRQLWCEQCKKWMDRDMVAAMNIASKGLAGFASSQGLAGEAMRGNPTTPVILRVDASKLCLQKGSDRTNIWKVS